MIFVKYLCNGTIDIVHLATSPGCSKTIVCLSPNTSVNTSYKGTGISGNNPALITTFEWRYA